MGMVRDERKCSRYYRWTIRRNETGRDCREQNGDVQGDEQDTKKDHPDQARVNSPLHCQKFRTREDSNGEIGIAKCSGRGYEPSWRGK